MAAKSEKDVLIVDDEDDFLELAEEIFAGSGYRIGTAHNGREVRALLKRTFFRLAIVDYRLPGDNGDAVADLIHASSPNTSIVFLTGDSSAARQIRKRFPSVDACLVKPVAVDELLRIVESLLKRKHTRGG